MSDRPSTPIQSDVPPATRARFYALLANALRYPDALLVEQMLGFSCEDSTDGFPDVGPAVLERLTRLRAVCGGAAQKSRSDILCDWQTDHARLFGHAVRGSCPPYELEYGQSEIIQQTAELADLAGFYAAFGLELRPPAFERPDYIAVECEFLSVLCAKEAWGLQNGCEELAESCRDAQRAFLRDHLARWLPAFASRLIEADPDGFYGAVASLGAAWLEEECRRFEIDAGPQWLELRPADPELDASIDCQAGECGPGAEERLIQLGVPALSEKAE